MTNEHEISNCLESERDLISNKGKHNILGRDIYNITYQLE